MKFLILAIGLLTSALAQADCQVQSTRYPELESGLNQATICREVKAAIETNFAVQANAYNIVVLANGFRTFQDVQIEILLQKNGVSVYRASGLMSWFPGGDSYVTIEE